MQYTLRYIEWESIVGLDGRISWRGYALDDLLCFTVEQVRDGKWSAVVDGKMRQDIASGSFFHNSAEDAKDACERRLRTLIGAEAAKC